MKKKWPIPRPTEHAALRNLDRAQQHRPRRQLATVPALFAALVDAVDRSDREQLCLAAHRVVQAATPEVGK
ncbi:hypothetical protein [Streptomyces mirabilis]|uniref:hypothetical protein n=1 Tax=Streptomyces mirabilis TaxID=68239 RepID=UPI0033BF5D1D